MLESQAKTNAMYAVIALFLIVLLAWVVLAFRRDGRGLYAPSERGPFGTESNPITREQSLTEGAVQAEALPPPSAGVFVPPPTTPLQLPKPPADDQPENPAEETTE